MRIKELKIKGFGRIKGTFRFDDERPVFILAPNETGKTTLAEAISWLLFDMPARKYEGKSKKPAEIYKPWDGSALAGEILVETRGRLLRVIRDFEARSVEIWDEKAGGKVTEEFRTGRNEFDVGKTIFGISREDFEKISYIPQNRLDALADGESIVNHLQRMSSSASGDTTAGEAILALRQALEKYEGVIMHKYPCRIESEIKKLEQRMDELRHKRNELFQRWKGYEQEAADLNERTREEEKIAHFIKEHCALRDAARLRELEEAGASLEGKRKRLDGLQAEIKKLEEMGAPPPGAEALDELEGQMNECEAVIGRWRVRIGELEAEDKGYEDELKKYAGYRNFSVADLESLKEIEQRWGVFAEDIERLDRDIAREEARLSGKGIDIEAVKKEAEDFGRLSKDEAEFLLGYAEARLNDERQKSDILQRQYAASPFSSWEPIMLGLFIASFICAGFLIALGRMPAGATASGLGIVFLATFVYLNRKRRGIFLAEMKEVTRRSAEREKRVAELARRVGYASGEEMLAAFRDKKQSDDALAGLNGLIRSKRGDEEKINKLKNDFADFWKEKDGPPFIGEITRGAVRNCINRIARVCDIQSKRALCGKQRSEVGVELDRTRKSYAEAEKKVSEILRGWNIVAADVRQGIKTFRQRQKEYERLSNIRDRELPQAKEDIPTDAALREMYDEMAALKKKIEAAGEKYKNLAPEKSSAHYRGVVEEAEAKRESLAGDINRLREAAGRDLDDIQAGFAALDEEYERTERHLKTARSFKQSVETAIEELDKISKESYRSWADMLNANVNEIIGRICPDYGEVVFKDDLNFSLLSKKAGRRLDSDEVSSHLSRGAIDQIYLAARLALCVSMSRYAETLPLILDDSFASSDDARFASGMRVLLSMDASSQQLIILSCHEERHRNLLRGEGVEDKVAIITL